MDQLAINPSGQKQKLDTGPLQGSLVALTLFDVAEEICLDMLGTVAGGKRVEPSFKHAAPGYVGFQRPPIVDALTSITVGEGIRVQPIIKYYDFGVIGVLFELPVSGTWEELVQLASRWLPGTELESHASRLAHQVVERAGGALTKPYSAWLWEDYFVFAIRQVKDATNASELLSRHGSDIAQLVRGEVNPLSETERNEVLQSSISYYSTDLAVIGWNAAFVFDTPAGAEAAIELMEYANSQLLEFRHYDELLTNAPPARSTTW